MKFNQNKLIVLCATQRCGSTMVVEDMRSTEVLGVPEEYFIPWNSTRTDIDWFKQLDEIARKASTDNGVVAVKIMANQLPEIEACLAHSWLGEPPSLKGQYPYFRAITSNANYIFIRRDSVVRQAISRGMSRQTGINHATGKVEDDHFAGNLLKGYKTSYNDNAQYKENAIDADVLAISKENLVWENYFSSWGIANPLSLRYEEICKNSPGYLARVAKYCSVDLQTDQIRDDRKMVKLSNNKNDEWCQLYLQNFAG